MQLVEPAPAKLNLALHVRGKLPDGRHRIETIFAFCTDGDQVAASPSDEISLSVSGTFAGELGETSDNLVLKAAKALRERAGIGVGAALSLKKNLPVASGIGGGSADAAAALRLLTRLWGSDPEHATAIAPMLGADVPACLLSITSRGEGAGDDLQLFDAGVSGSPVLLVNPRVELSTAKVFSRWNGEDKGPLDDWRAGRNDLEAAAVEEVPLIGTVLAWLAIQQGAKFVRMSGSGATCFALFETEEARDNAQIAVPREWWRLATYLR
ncbi:MAG: 4-(cytidine 5'-diphospho)-2-C-methyl-D-erythritol kinase [Sphingomonas sp.]|nr:4-(cytidine 5'-diphospho)-2-C-methyl-D-erythritol kinase [Sphingomonas sp.]